MIIKKFNIKDLRVIIFIVLLMLINLIILSNFISDYKNETDRIEKLTISPQENIEEKDNSEDIKSVEEKEINKIKSKSEYERMQYYFTQYINYIQAEEYENAYNVLYPEFKEQYFPTLEQFIEYVKKIYPSFVAFEYKDFSRQGTVYVMTVKIIDPVHAKAGDEEVTQRIILKENNFYDYVLSFQVI